MSVVFVIKQALLNLSSSKLRSFLAVLGILVGTAAVVALLSCGRLATEKALAEFKVLGTDLLAVTTYSKEARQANSGGSETSLSFWRQLQIPGVIQIAPYATTYQPLSYQGHVLQAAIVGADESLASVIHINVAEGHFVSFVDSFEHYCVLGADIARQIRQWNIGELIGSQLQIGQALYTVIGVASPWQENSFFNEDINQAVIVPVAGIRLVTKDSQVNSAVMLLRENVSVDEIMDTLRQRISQQAPNLSVFFRSAKQIINSMESQDRIFTVLLAAIGGISLFVGGIGIMNIMLVSVTERKREIGIRKAVGAKNRDIQALFLAESILLSCLGGGFGVLTGIFLTYVLAYFSHWPFYFYPLPPAIGFFVSCLTGIISGFYPASRAAKLEPIVSLRSD